MRSKMPTVAVHRLLFLFFAAALALPSTARAEEKKLPAVWDLCKYQTPIRDQGGRGTCTYFPPVAALEAAYRRQGIEVDLSSEHLIWVRNVTACQARDEIDDAENLASTQDGGGGLYNVGLLQKYGVCPAQDLPYHPNVGDWGGDYYKGFDLRGYRWDLPFSQFLLNRWNFDPRQLPPRARLNAKYGIDKFVTLSAEDRKNPRKFEEILAAGHEIVFALVLHQNQEDYEHGDPLWRIRPNAKPEDPNMSHEMLVVGYDHKRRFFIVKNQWGPTNYSALKHKLAPGWRDVVKYDGYQLIDYNYLSACTEAGYITAVTPVGAPRFKPQRALGQWQATFSHQNKPIISGVLTWRRLPDPDGAKPNFRIGDLLTQDGMQYRVNGQLDGDGAKPYTLSLYIDLDNGSIPFDSTHGFTWTGELNLPEKGGGTLKLQGANSAQTVWGVRSAEVQLAATLVENKNLLKSMHDPRNLLVNGSFEEGPGVENFWPLEPGSTELKGWKVTRGQIDYIGTNWQSADGARSLDLHGSPGFGGIQQTFKTIKGLKYRVTFSFSANPEGNKLTKKMATQPLERA